MFEIVVESVVENVTSRALEGIIHDAIAEVS